MSSVLQLGLFTPAPRARRRDPETSHAAAAKAVSIASDHRTRIAAALEKGNGNIYELGARCGLSHVQVARRMIEMETAGAAHPTEEKREGCRVWAKGPKP